MIELERAVKLWNAGLTMTQIGKELSLTKGQVAGTISRNRELFSRRVDPIKRLEAEIADALFESIKEDERPKTSSRLSEIIVSSKPKNVPLKYLKNQTTKLASAYLDATGETLGNSEVKDLMLILVEVEKERRSSNALRKAFSEVEKKPKTEVKAASILYDRKRLKKGKKLCDLGKDQCHWPLNEGGPFLFCAEVKDGKNYCANHSARATQ